MLATWLKRGPGYLDLARQAWRARSARDPAVRDAARRHLATRLGRLRGLPQKIGQILSMAGDEQHAAPFAALRESAEPLPAEEFLAALREAWNAEPETLLSEFEPRGLAASLGQVHRARLHDGREVAIKLPYPGIREALLTDLSALGWITLPIGGLRRGFDLRGYRDTILHDLEQELDYRGEAQRQTRFAEQLRGCGGWVVPAVIHELSNEHVLVSAWESGQVVESAREWSESARRTLAAALLHGALHMLFRCGVLHADPHPGNYRFRQHARDAQIVLYDFGSVVELEPRARRALLRLIHDTRAQSGDAFATLLELGFDAELLEPLAERLPALCRVLFEPFCQTGAFALADWRRGERAADILGELRWNFRMAGPPKLVFVLRAFAGLAFYLERLGVDVSWSRALEPILLEQRDELIAPGAAVCDATPHSTEQGQRAAVTPRSRFESMARHLQIVVTQSGSTKVALTFPASAIDDLDELMDEAVQARVKAAGIDTAALLRRVRATGYVPQAVFSLDESHTNKGVRVWLE